MSNRLPTGSPAESEVPIVLGTKYGTRRQEVATKFAKARRARRAELQAELALGQRRAGSAKVARELGSGAVTAGSLMQPGSRDPDEIHIDDSDIGDTKMPWRGADVSPKGDPNDFENQQASALDPGLVSPEVRKDLVPSAQGEMHPSGSRVERFSTGSYSKAAPDQARG